jgi:hypothetical protein
VTAVVIATPWIDFSALWRIVVVGLLAGAGLPALFAIGLRSLAWRPAPGAGSDADDAVYGGRPLGLAVGLACFAVVLAAIGYGIYLVVHSS